MKDEEDRPVGIAEDLKNPERTSELLQRADLSDDALALMLTDRHRNELLYVNKWGQWLRWDDARWQPEETLVPWDLARDLVRDLIREQPLTAAAAKALRSAKTIYAVVSLARSDRAHARKPEDFDRHAMLLNTPAGTVDLRTGKMRPHSRTDNLTKVTPVSPAGDCPLWLDCLGTWTRGEAELQGFLKRFAGYCLTGLTKEEVLPILYGPGGNGKTRFVEALRLILGTDYMTNVAMETLIVTYGEQHPTDMASLRSMRVAVAVETEAGRQLAESKVKQLTGGDRLRARFMRQDFFEFDPTHKLIIVGNHKPRLTNLDEAIKRRVLLVPFEAVIPAATRDKDLAEKLKAEAPGILQWAIDGCLEWQQQGLNPPESVRAASAKYFEEQDDFGQWLEERTVLQSSAHTIRTALFEDWRMWADAHGCKVRTSHWLYENLRTRKLYEGKIRGKPVWRGIGLKGSHG